MQFVTNVKPLQVGFAVRAGIESALLARAGISGHAEVIESERGFAGLMWTIDGELNNSETLGHWKNSECRSNCGRHVASPTA